MAFITSTEMFKKSLKSDYAVGAFNVNNMEIIQGIVDAAKQEQAPIILQIRSEEHTSELQIGRAHV